MTQFSKDFFVFENGLWVAKIKNILVRIKGGEYFFNHHENLEFANKFIRELNKHEEIARSYSMMSKYLGEIESIGKLLLQSFNLNGRSDVRAWFTLGNTDRMLGVHYSEKELLSVYCDPP